MYYSSAFRTKMLMYNIKIQRYRNYTLPELINNLKKRYNYVLNVVFIISMLLFFIVIALMPHIWPLLSALATILAVWAALYVHNEQPKMKLRCDLQLEGQSVSIRIFNERNSSVFLKCSSIYFKDYKGLSLFGDQFDDIIKKHYSSYYNINANKITNIELNKDSEGYDRMQYIYNRIRNRIASNERYKKTFDDTRIEKGSIIMFFSYKDRPRLVVRIPIKSLLLRGMVVKK